MQQPIAEQQCNNGNIDGRTGNGDIIETAEPVHGYLQGRVDKRSAIHHDSGVADGLTPSIEENYLKSKLASVEPPAATSTLLFCPFNLPCQALTVYLPAGTLSML